jgi:hypothetical protein
MQLPTKDDCSVSFRALPIIILCGIFGILPDIDHVAAFLSGVPKESDHRIWHPTIFIVCCIIVLCISAYYTGLYFRTVLRKR